MKYVFTNKVEFYITNVCNLTCEQCNRFNDHKFTGWQKWSDYADVYKRWAEYIEIKNIVLIGGEPLLNSTINEWILGLSEIFSCGIEVLSNGTRLNLVPGLYDALLKMKDHGVKLPGNVSISLHHLDDFADLKENIKQFLGPLKEEYGIGIGVPGPDPGKFYSARDVNDILVSIHLSNEFGQSSLVTLPNGRFSLHNSDVERAHNHCAFARYKCYHFIRGKIYKCGPVALLPEFDQQFNLDISDEDRVLLNSYTPLTVDTWNTQSTQWLEELDEPIPQCKFCPSVPRVYKLKPMQSPKSSL